MTHKKIVVIDDNPDAIYAVKAAFRKEEDYEILAAAGGDEGLELINKEQPDIILLDIMMPKTDGWQVATKVKSNEETRDIPLIFLTAKTDNLSQGMGALSSEDYITKPVQGDELVERIKKVLDQQKSDD